MTSPLPRGAPCESCGLPIRTVTNPSDRRRRYCRRVLCTRLRHAARSLAHYRRLGAAGPRRQRERYDAATRHARYMAANKAKQPN